MEQYPTIRLLKAARNCSSSCAQAGGQVEHGLGGICLDSASLWHWGATDLPDVRISVVHLRYQSLGHEQAPAARVFDFNRIASEQALAAKV